MPPMTNEAFDTHLAKSCHRLEACQAVLQTEYALSHYTQWTYDHAGGVLRFTDEASQKSVAFAAYPIGTFNKDSGVFRWGWANPNLPPEIQSKSRVFTQLSEKTGMKAFEMDGFKASSDIVWELAALCFAETQGLGCYLAPSGTQKHLLLIDSVCEPQVS